MGLPLVGSFGSETVTTLVAGVLGVSVTGMVCVLVKTALVTETSSVTLELLSSTSTEMGSVVLGVNCALGAGLSTSMVGGVPSLTVKLNVCGPLVRPRTSTAAAVICTCVPATAVGGTEPATRRVVPLLWKLAAFAAPATTAVMSNTLPSPDAVRSTENDEALGTGPVAGETRVNWRLGTTLGSTVIESWAGTPTLPDGSLAVAVMVVEPLVGKLMRNSYGALVATPTRTPSCVNATVSPGALLARIASTKMFDPAIGGRLLAISSEATAGPGVLGSQTVRVTTVV